MTDKKGFSVVLAAGSDCRCPGTKQSETETLWIPEGTGSRTESARISADSLAQK